jgi:carboxyl-terminal processing protease
MTKAVYDLDPVPAHWVDGNTGYVALRTFIATAEPLLRAVFQEFKDAGVQNVVIDLRYNGGGLVDTARILANLLAAGPGQSGAVMFNQQFNSSQSASSNRTYYFGSEVAAGTFQRVAFITTHASASASELVPNSLDPYLDIAFVGARTYGKPVGQYVFELSGCNRMLFLVSFKTVNFGGVGDYYDGLPVTGAPPASRGPLCQAEDDLTHPQGDASEASTQAAIYFARNGSCPPAPAGARRATGLPVPSDTPRPVHPTSVQQDIPGLF